MFLISLDYNEVIGQAKKTDLIIKNKENVIKKFKTTLKNKEIKK